MPRSERFEVLLQKSLDVQPHPPIGQCPDAEVNYFSFPSAPLRLQPGWARHCLSNRSAFSIPNSRTISSHMGELRIFCW